MLVSEFLATITNEKIRIIICASNEKVLIEIYKHENNYLADIINAAVITETAIKNSATIKLVTNIEVQDE